MHRMIATFDKPTQTAFYANLTEAMNLCDQLKPKTAFHPELLIINDKNAIKEVVVEDFDADLSEKDFKRFWITNYPLLCYVIKDSGLTIFTSNRLVFRHLSDLNEGAQMTFTFPKEEKFIALVESFGAEINPSIYALVKSSKNGKNVLIVRSYTYLKPFEKKDFTD